MAGMLPGVESARRRKLHQSGGLSDSATVSGYGFTRRPSFCLYAGNHDFHLRPYSSMQRNMLKQAHQDEKLGEVAREAKERLDETLRSQRNSLENKRTNSQEKLKGRTMEGRSMVLGDLQTEVFGLKNRGLKRFKWANLSWRSSGHEECAVCLDQFKVGQTLVHLPCAHRYHSRCLVPWLENNSHCPCCRMGIFA